MYVKEKSIAVFLCEFSFFLLIPLSVFAQYFFFGFHDFSLFGEFVEVVPSVPGSLGMELLLN